jgi:hypothetical protein
MYNTTYSYLIKNRGKFLYFFILILVTMSEFNRRNVLKATALGGSGLAALAYSPRPTLAASNWTANSPSQVSNESGSLSSLEIPASGFSFSLEYAGLGAGTHSIDFELEAKLDSSFETVFSDSFEVTGDSGTVTESKLSTSFPVDLLANTSMSASDFEEPNAGETKSTTVDLRVSFSWSDGEYSASDSSTTSFDVTIENTSPTHVVVDDFEDGDISEYGGNNGDYNVNTEDSQNGTYSLECADNNKSNAVITSDEGGGLDTYPGNGDVVRLWFKVGNESGGDNNVQSTYFIMKNDGSGNAYGFGAYPDNSVFRIVRFDGDLKSETVLTSTNSSLVSNPNTWMEFTCQVQSDGTIEMKIYDSDGNLDSSISTTDSTHIDNSNGIGFHCGQDNISDRSRFDHVRIVN